MKSKVKTIVRNQFIAIVVLSTIFAFNTEAQKQDRSTAQELYSYFQTNVAPELKPLRAEFDANLSAEEKEQILALRSELKKIRQAKKDIGLEQPLKDMTKEELSDEQIEFLNESRTQSIHLLLDAKELAQKHEDEINEILANLPEFENWKGDMMNIALKGRKSGAFIINPVFKGNLKRMVSRSDIKNVMFLLWDPNNQFTFNL